VRIDSFKYLLGCCLSLALCLTIADQGLGRVTTPVRNGVTMQAFGVSDYQNNRPFYMILLKLPDVKGAKYVIERQTIGETDRVKLLECSYEVMAENLFKFTDVGGLQKHGRYRYFLRFLDEAGQETEVSTIALVKNLSFKDEAQKYFPVVTQGIVTFTLGPKCDWEDEKLEYRLYTRIPGGGGDTLLNSWTPVNDSQTVTAFFSKTCEWRLVCIESDTTIPDRVESVLVNWSLFVAN
jgi:hypothetical protein